CQRTPRLIPGPLSWWGFFLKFVREKKEQIFTKEQLKAFEEKTAWEEKKERLTTIHYKPGEGIIVGNEGPKKKEAGTPAAK
ncbi:MAG: hypothetical protein HQL21_09360, partial [Candidatus Omnitrophica bacterium]|nr:hypothetical protein [Candidatus Omnitrophota bacterium]